MRKPPKGRRRPEAPADPSATSTLADLGAADPRAALKNLSLRRLYHVEHMNDDADAMIAQLMRQRGLGGGVG